jgi:hypothetical protein
VRLGVLTEWVSTDLVDTRSWQAAVYDGVRLAVHRATRATQFPLAPFILADARIVLALLNVWSGCWRATPGDAGQVGQVEAVLNPTQ